MHKRLLSNFANCFRLLCAGLMFLSLQSFAEQTLPDNETLRLWVAEMKTASRGPFKQIRWFCADGTVLPPKAFACREHGGGSQHGEWNDRVKLMRAHEYYIANIYADLDVDGLVRREDVGDVYGQMLLEAFLQRVDDGWVYRKARFYRGALQEEGERRGGRALLLALASDPVWVQQRFLPLRLGARLIAHGADTPTVTGVRETATALAGEDAAFKPLRNKIHVKPQASDADLVRTYAQGVQDPAQRAKYEEFADAIVAAYTSSPTSEALRTLSQRVGAPGELASALEVGATQIQGSADAETRFGVSAALMLAIRDAMPRVSKPVLRLEMLEVSLALEATHYVAATELRAQANTATRRQQLRWLNHSLEAIYGAGLISARQLDSLRVAASELDADVVSLGQFKRSLDYLALAPGWSGQWIQFHFHPAIVRYTAIEPMTTLFAQDLLRGSGLFFFAQTLDELLRDANKLAGVRHELFGKEVGSGLRALNPGLARGVLFSVVDSSEHVFESNGVYLLPETTSDLPPVAGILTAGEGNALSHVQLLARNLGIPNVGIDPGLIPELSQWDGTGVLLAVSPAGSVQLIEDDAPMSETEQNAEQQGEVLIEPDLQKLDLSVKRVIALDELGAADSGRTVGPKAAKLGELKQHFPGAVANGLVIPFGVFRDLLKQPRDSSGEPMYDWMVRNYRELERLPAESAERKAATEAFRAALEAWIQTADAGEAFRAELRNALEKTFGADGSYGVFVRSDTNVEDLPGFTGAGLNLTVPNVVGTDNIIAAVSRVWASPFSARAFAWRQSHMRQPEHVYPAVLLLKSVAADKSGVLVSIDVDSGDPRWLSVAVNEGVGGAVDGQAAESLRIDTRSGDVRLIAQATARVRRTVAPTGGVAKKPVSGNDRVLGPEDIRLLVALVEELPQRFPGVVNAEGQLIPVDIEFGFRDGELMLFQIRPFVESSRARSNDYLRALDSGLRDLREVQIDLNQPPAA